MNSFSIKACNKNLAQIRLRRNHSSLDSKNKDREDEDSDYGINTCAMRNPKLRRIMDSFGARYLKNEKSRSKEREYHPSKWSVTGWKYVDKDEIEKSYLRKRDMIGNYDFKRSEEDHISDNTSTYQDLHCKLHKNLTENNLKRINPDINMKVFHDKKSLRYPPIISSRPIDHYSTDKSNSGIKLAQKHALVSRSLS
mmetsp:Transcript_21353/g.18952  ORF Transcript_21353/g.18952 Transcript_21353/m.18952 type:complete len:196 (+) Transcript_21353:18-605(+)